MKPFHIFIAALALAYLYFLWKLGSSVDEEGGLADKLKRPTGIALFGVLFVYGLTEIGSGSEIILVMIGLVGAYIVSQAS